MRNVVVSGSFDDPRTHEFRFLEEAATVGRLHVLLWPDEVIHALTGRPPRFPESERLYLLQAIRYTHEVRLGGGPDDTDAFRVTFPGVSPDVWAVDERDESEAIREACETNGMAYRVIPDARLKLPPAPPPPLAHGVESDTDNATRRPRVVVTGCYDWFHSGHVRFFEEVSELGELYVVVGHDANIRLLKGEGHPMFPQDERRYIAGSIRYVAQALVSSGTGWMDAAPEIAAIRPDMYAVNEDGDVPEKRSFCETHGLRYVVLKRTPKEGLPRRQSTDLRGF